METGEHMRNCTCEICVNYRRRKLIEDAGPELLEALKTLFQEADYMVRMTGLSMLSEIAAQRYVLAIQQARTAISKAQGAS